ncbi:MAG: redoxin domain-containing protein, partial [Rhizobiaceae bacterium]
METAANLGSAVQAAIELDAPLNARLKLVANAVRRFQPDRAAAVDRLVDRLLEQRVGSTAPKVGERLPDFLLPDDVGRLTPLQELLAHGPTVVSFQRGHWCPYCRTSAVSIAAVQDEIAAAGGRIVVIVPERVEFALKLKQSSGASFPILSDMDNGYALSLNLAVWVGQEMEGH